MRTLTTVEQMTAWAVESKRGGQRVGLVPTMGYLHAGHGTLMALLRPQVDRLVVSIYVNPLQFGAHEDLDTYPSDFEADLALCAEQGVDAIFAPTDLYPNGFSTSVEVAGLTDGLCGASRPTFFEGITTVCARLFNLTRCDVACFGEKDFQQLAVIRRMVRDLAMPLEVVGAPLIRETDGLAMSSRNVYLSTAERRRAQSLNTALRAMRAASTQGERSVPRLLELGHSLLDVDELDYLEVRAADDLSPLSNLDRPSRALVGCWLGARRTRLIDNMGLTC